MKSTERTHRFGGAARIFEWLLNLILLVGSITILIYFAMIARLSFADLAPDYLVKDVDVMIDAGQLVTTAAYANTDGLHPRQVEARLTLPPDNIGLYLTHHIGMLVGYLCTFAAGFQLRQFVRSLRRKHPFIPANARRLRCVAWLLLFGGVWGVLARVLETSELAKAFPKLDLHLSIPGNPIPLLLILVLFVIAEVFALGVKMKEEADLTV